jgi:hypothetical protein
MSVPEPRAPRPEPSAVTEPGPARPPRAGPGHRAGPSHRAGPPSPATAPASAVTPASALRVHFRCRYVFPQYLRKNVPDLPTCRPSPHSCCPNGPSAPGLTSTQPPGRPAYPSAPHVPQAKIQPQGAHRAQYQEWRVLLRSLREHGRGGVLGGALGPQDGDPGPERYRPPSAVAESAVCAATEVRMSRPFMTAPANDRLAGVAHTSCVSFPDAAKPGFDAFARSRVRRDGAG